MGPGEHPQGDGVCLHQVPEGGGVGGLGPDGSPGWWDDGVDGAP